MPRRPRSPSRRRATRPSSSRPSDATGPATATGDAEENRILKLWEQARKQGALTENGKNLKRDIERFQAAEKEVGYGELTSIGKAELAGLGRRTADNYAEFFSRAQEDGDKIEFVTSPVKRTKESAEAMKGAIKRRFPDLTFAKDAVSERTLVIGANPSPIGLQHIRRLRSKEIPNVELAAQQHPAEHLPAPVRRQREEADRPRARHVHDLPAGAEPQGRDRRDLREVRRPGRCRGVRAGAGRREVLPVRAGHPRRGPRPTRAPSRC